MNRTGILQTTIRKGIITLAILLGVGLLFSPLLHAQMTPLPPAIVAAAAAAASQTDPITGPNLPMVGMFYSA